MESKKWYQKDMGIILLLIVFFPVGLYLMWKHAKWNKKVKWAVSGFFAFLVFIQVLVTGSADSPQSSRPTNASLETVEDNTQEPEPVEQMQIDVTSQIVKKVEGKHRYFFDIRNNDTEDFEGSVMIMLFKEGANSALGQDTFETTRAIEPGLGTSVNFDISTGPVSVHGENGITRFEFVVKKDGQVVNEGEGVISVEYEDIDAYDFNF